MKYVVFGGTGFIGKNLVRYLRSKGEEVLSISRAGNNDSIAIDIKNYEEFSRIKYEPQVIINCASQVPLSGISSEDSYFTSQLFSTNVIGGLNIAKWAIEIQAAKVFNLSTLVVSKKPWPDPLIENYISLPEGKHVGYAMSKLSQELVMNECLSNNSNINLTHLRLSAVYGVGMKPEGILYKLMNDLRNNNDIELTNSIKNTLNFINVNDVCRLIFLLSNQSSIPSVLNLANGKSVSVMELAELLKEIVGSNSKIKNIENQCIPNKANIGITNLKSALDSNELNFLPLRSGLITLVENFKRE